MDQVMVIGIAGGTGSGKTTITRRLMQRFGGDVSVIYHDNYYKAHHDMPYEERAKLNYDHPDAFDTDLLIQAVRDRGRSLESVVNQYLNTVKPMHERYVEPSKRNADIIVPEGGHNRVALELLMERVRAHLEGKC